MSDTAPILPAFSFPNPSFRGAHLLTAACPYCEKTHQHGEPHALPVDTITYRGAHCIDASTSPLYGHDYGLQIVKIFGANDDATLAPRRGNRKPLHVRLAKLAPRLRRATLRVIIPLKPNAAGAVETGDTLKLSASDPGKWRIVDLKEATGPTWRPKLIANGDDFASLVALITGAPIETVIAALVRSLNFNVDPEFHDGVAGIVHRWQARRTATGVATASCHSGFATCFDRPSDIGHYIGGVTDWIVRILGTGERHSEIRQAAAEAFPGEHLARTYDLPAGVVAYRLIEAAWAVKFDAIAAGEFMRLPDSLQGGASGVGERIRRMFCRPLMAPVANDNPATGSAAEIGGDA